MSEVLSFRNLPAPTSSAPAVLAPAPPGPRPGGPCPPDATCTLFVARHVGAVTVTAVGPSGILCTSTGDRCIAVSAIVRRFAVRVGMSEFRSGPVAHSHVHVGRRQQVPGLGREQESTVAEQNSG